MCSSFAQHGQKNKKKQKKMDTFLTHTHTHTAYHLWPIRAVEFVPRIVLSWVFSDQWEETQMWVMFVGGEWLTAETAARLPQEDSARCHQLHVSALPVFIIPAPCLKIVISTTVIPLWKKIASVKALRTRQCGNASAQCIFITEIQMNFKSEAD